MKKAQLISILGRSILAVLFFILLHGLFDGIFSRPAELDSIYYHIPIAKGLLNGTVFRPTEKITLQQYFPGSSEAILSIFMLLHIPLNTYNVVSVVMFFFALYLLGKRQGFTRWYAVIFAAATAGMVGITRWMDTQIIDIWMGVWYVLLLVLLEKPVTTAFYPFALGTVTGMVIGTKYSGLFYIVPVFLLYRKKTLSALGNAKGFFLFLLPFGVLGLFWYLRNYIVMGNPIYPLSLFGMPGIKTYVFAVMTWEAFLRYPMDMVTAILSEWGLWGSTVVLIPLYLRRKTPHPIYLLAALNSAVFLLLPSGRGYPLYVSNLRYAVPTAVPLILSAFIYLKSKGWEKYLAVAAYAQMLFSVRVAYHPKLLILFVPAVFCMFFPELIRKIIYNHK